MCVLIMRNVVMMDVFGYTFLYLVGSMVVVGALFGKLAQGLRNIDGRRLMLGDRLMCPGREDRNGFHAGIVMMIIVIMVFMISRVLVLVIVVVRRPLVVRGLVEVPCMSFVGVSVTIL